jgi:hypothetical protein
VKWRRLILVSAVASCALSCATPAQMHTDAQLNEVATGCGLALGELIQDESEKRLLLMIRQDSTPRQRVCVARWARKNGLRAVFVNMSFPEG